MWPVQVLSFRLSRLTVAAAALLFALGASTATEEELLQPVSVVAAGLTEGNPAAALRPLLRAAPGYERLRSYFDGLTRSAYVSNSVSVANSSVEGSRATLQVSWTMTLTNRSDASANETRKQTLTVNQLYDGHDWRIVSLEPVDFFSPAPSTALK